MTVLQQLSNAGVRLELSRDDLVVRPRSPLTDTQVAFLRDHKAELVEALKARRKRRRDELLMMLADNPGVRYAYAVDDASTDPVVIAVGIRDLATFEMTIPADRYDPFAILQLFEAEGP